MTPIRRKVPLRSPPGGSHGQAKQRGLELSFKPAKGARGRGRWYKRSDGRALYFGWGDGVSDRASYQTALAAYRRHLADRARDGQAARRTAATRKLQHALSAADDRPELVDPDEVRGLIADLQAADGVADPFVRAADSAERRHIVRELRARLDGATLDELRSLARPPAAETKTGGPTGTVKELLRSFVDTQRRRMERRTKLDTLRAAGQDVRAASREDLSPGRFVEITYNVATFERACGEEPWDGTEATAARVVAKFRAAADQMMLGGEVKPRTFNKWITLARQFCGWAESTYRLDRLPRDKSLFAKYDVGDSQAKAVPVETLKTLWRAADDRGRSFILLALNCGFYAVDISDLRAEQIGRTHISHVRGKSGVRVRYLLWRKTRDLLKKTAARTGRAFTTREGTPLVHYSKLAESGEPARVDNVRNWWVRMCATAGLKGYTFSNLRDTASTTVESVDRTLTDLSLVRHGRLAPEAVWELKAQALKKNGLLTLHRGGERFGDLGGLDALKHFCTRALAAGSGSGGGGGNNTKARPRGILLLGCRARARARSPRVRRLTAGSDCCHRQPGLLPKSRGQCL